MDNDSTRNGVPLSFADTLSPLERAALGLQADLSQRQVSTIIGSNPYQQRQGGQLAGLRQPGRLACRLLRI